MSLRSDQVKRFLQGEELLDTPITLGEYERAHPLVAILIDQMTNRVHSILEEMAFPASPLREVNLSPFQPETQDIQAALWAGVPALVFQGKSEGKGLAFWAWVEGFLGQTPSYAALRVMPGPQEDSLAFVPIRCDCLREAMSTLQGHQLGDPLERLPIGIHQDALIRLDRMAVAALALATHPGTLGESFRELLDQTPLAVFMGSLWKFTYSITPRNPLVDQSRQFVQAAKMVLDYAYPATEGRFTLDDVRRLRETIIKPTWDLDKAWPVYYNLVIPPSLFQAVEECVLKGHAPILPQYLTTKAWLFNGLGEDNCLGPDPNPGNSRGSQKIWAGMHSSFNVDLPGGISCWPGTPVPAEWFALLIQAMGKLQEEPRPLSVADQASVALEYALAIPCMFQGNEQIFNLARTLDSVQYCDSSGNPKEVPPCSDPAPARSDSDPNSDSETCYNCGAPLERNNYPPYSCQCCGEIFCEECYGAPNSPGRGTGHGSCTFCDFCNPADNPHPSNRMTECENCGLTACPSHLEAHCEGCSRDLCTGCYDNSAHTCEDCVSCGERYPLDELSNCPRCGVSPLCEDCLENHCLSPDDTRVAGG